MEENKLPEKRQATNIEEILMAAVEKGANIEVMERLLAMRKELKAEAAKDQFAAAMAEFQALRPRIPKRHKVLNRDGSFRYKYAKLDDIIELIQEPLAKCGLSFKWEPTFSQDGKNQYIESACIVTHVAGHSERSTFRVPVILETSAMNGIQSFGSASTYAKRYSLCDAFGISPDEDDDAGTATFKNTIPVEAVKGQTKSERLANMMDAAVVPKEKVEKLDEIKNFLVTKWPGDSQKEKDNKAAALETFFGTPKWTQVGNIPLNVLTDQFETMQKELGEPEKGEPEDQELPI